MYKVEFAKKAVKILQKLDPTISRAIVSWIKKNLEGCDNPRQYGKALKGTLSSCWRYRVGDYRIIASIEDKKLIIVVITVGHRKEVYN